MSTVKIVQTFKHKWEIVSTEKGVVLQRDINIQSPHDAEVYVRNYCSSFMNWTYEVVPLPKEDSKNGV